MHEHLDCSSRCSCIQPPAGVNHITHEHTLHAMGTGIPVCRGSLLTVSNHRTQANVLASLVMGTCKVHAIDRVLVPVGGDTAIQSSEGVAPIVLEGVAPTVLEGVAPIVLEGVCLLVCALACSLPALMRACMCARVCTRDGSCNDVSSRGFV